MPGVKDVVPIKVFTNNCRASLDVVVFNGLPPEKLRTARKLELQAGNWGDFDSRTDAAVVGQAIAARRNLKAGEKFTIGDVTVSIVGTFRSTVAAEDNFIYTHLDFLQRARGKTSVGTVTQLEVQLAEGAEPRRDQPRDRRRVPQRSGRHDDALQGRLSARYALRPGGTDRLCPLAGLRLRRPGAGTGRHDDGHGRARSHQGTCRPADARFAAGRIFRLVLAESVLQSIAGGVLGIGCGTLLLFLGGFAIGAEGVTIAFQPSLEVATLGADCFGDCGIARRDHSWLASGGNGNCQSTASCVIEIALQKHGGFR